MSVPSARVLIALLLATGCSNSATQMIVTIDAEPGVKMESARLHVVVLGGVGRTTAPTAARFDRMLRPGDADPSYPITIGLAPLDGDVGRSYSVTATAETATGTFVGQVRIIGGYVEGETLRVTITLEDACRAVTCGAEETCAAGVCVDARDSGVPRPFDAGRGDGGSSLGDASGDGGVRDADARDAGSAAFTPRNLTADIWDRATGGVLVVASATIDTDSGAVLIDGLASRDFASVIVIAAGDCRPILALVTSELRVAAGATVSVTGSRALAIVATGPIVIDGTLDVGAHGTVAGPGGTIRAYGGGYGSAGALAGCKSGGTIPTFGSADLLGLCGGSQQETGPTETAPGGAGGALHLASLADVSIGSTGVIRAVGGGGGPNDGGASGGGILLQAPTVTVAGTISVNGGGGGGQSEGEDGRLAEAGRGGPGRSTTMTCGTFYFAAGGEGAWQGGAARPGGSPSRDGTCGTSTCMSGWGSGGGGGAGRIRIDADVRDYRAGRVLEYTGLTGVFSDGPLN